MNQWFIKYRIAKNLGNVNGFYPAFGDKLLYDDIIKKKDKGDLI